MTFSGSSDESQTSGLCTGGCYYHPIARRPKMSYYSANGIYPVSFADNPGTEKSLIWIHESNCSVRFLTSRFFSLFFMLWRVWPLQVFLSISGWEDLIETASAGGHLSQTARRLVVAAWQHSSWPKEHKLLQHDEILKSHYSDERADAKSTCENSFITSSERHFLTMVV